MNNLIAVEKIAGWDKLKTLVLDSISSPNRTAPMPTWAKLAIDVQTAASISRNNVAASPSKPRSA
jgi:hypothetical protein